MNSSPMSAVEITLKNSLKKKVKGDYITDHNLTAGTWLEFWGPLDSITNNLLIGAIQQKEHS